MPSISHKIGSFLDRLRDVFRRGKEKEETDKSVQWLRAKLDTFSAYQQKMSPRKTIKTLDPKTKAATELANKTAVGSMFMMHYDPKYKMTLPYYDRFPLFIVVGEAKGGWYGLNTHYLPAVLKARFFDALLDTLTTGNNITENSRLAITYNLLKNTQKYKFFKPCFKHYLTTHVRSQIYWVSPEDWFRALFIQNEQFVKASRTKVYFDSRKMIM